MIIIKLLSAVVSANGATINYNSRWIYQQFSEMYTNMSSNYTFIDQIKKKPCSEDLQHSYTIYNKKYNPLCWNQHELHSENVTFYWLIPHVTNEHILRQLLNIFAGDIADWFHVKCY